MPRCASSKTPVRRSCAPVNAPFSCPKISLSSSVSGIAAQLMATNGNDGARAQLVDGLRHELLAGARLAPHEHRRRRRRRLLDHAIERANPGAVADDAAEAALLAQLAPQELDLAQRLLPLDRLVQQDPQPLRIDGLAQVVVGAVLDRVDRALDRALRREQDEGDVRQLILQRAEQVVPAHPRHDQVAHDDRRAEAGDLAEAFLAIGRLVGLEAPGLHELRQPGPAWPGRPRR